MKLTIACVSGSLAGPVPAYCESPGTPIGPHCTGSCGSGRRRCRSTEPGWPDRRGSSTRRSTARPRRAPVPHGVRRRSPRRRPRRRGSHRSRVLAVRRPCRTARRRSAARPPENPRPTCSASRSSGPIAGGIESVVRRRGAAGRGAAGRGAVLVVLVVVVLAVVVAVADSPPPCVDVDATVVVAWSDPHATTATANATAMQRRPFHRIDRTGPWRCHTGAMGVVNDRHPPRSARVSC